MYLDVVDWLERNSHKSFLPQSPEEAASSVGHRGPVRVQALLSSTGKSKFERLQAITTNGEWQSSVLTVNAPVTELNLRYYYCTFEFLL